MNLSATRRPQTGRPDPAGPDDTHHTIGAMEQHILVSDGHINWTCDRVKLVDYLERHGWTEAPHSSFSTIWFEPDDEEAYEKLCLHVPVVRGECAITEADEELPQFAWYPHLAGWVLM